MGIELVNGRAGEPHVSGEDVGRLYRGIAGDGAYYLGGTTPSLSMATANRLSMGPCDLLLAGMHATLDGLDEWTIENGSQGMKRRDLCVLRYSRDASTGVEELRPATVKGSATDGTPVDPSYAKGSRADGSQTFDVPVARVELDGLTPGEPQLLVQKLGPLSSLWDSVSPVVLYAGKPGFSAGVTLSQSAAGFAQVLIEFVDTDGVRGSAWVDHPSKPVAVCLMTARVTSLGWFVKSRGVVVDGARISTQLPSESGYAVGEVANGTSSVKDCIEIQRVVGYRAG